MRVVILSGGSGTRLWPLSNGVQPKQFLRVLDGPGGGKECMLQRICRQLGDAGIPWDHIYIVAGREQADYIRGSLGLQLTFIEEPEQRNTFPAAALAALYLSDCERIPADETVVVMPADVYTEQGYFDVFREMDRLCAADAAELVLMGIRPERASDQFGYIVPEDGCSGNVPGAGTCLKVRRFEEKPSADRAEELIAEGALWNGGVFAFRSARMTERLRSMVPGGSYERLREHYTVLERTSFDVAVAEKLSDIAAVPYEGPWMDLGTWDALVSVMTDAVSGNVISTHGSDNTVIINELQIPLAVVGVPDAVVCVSENGILVADRKESANIRQYLKDCGGGTDPVV